MGQAASHKALARPVCYNIRPRCAGLESGPPSPFANSILSGDDLLCVFFFFALVCIAESCTAGTLGGCGATLCTGGAALGLLIVFNR